LTFGDWHSTLTCLVENQISPGLVEDEMPDQLTIKTFGFVIAPTRFEPTSITSSQILVSTANNLFDWWVEVF